MTRAGVARRELGKSLQVKLHSIVKRAVRDLATALEREGRLLEADLAYFLSREELRSLCGIRGTVVPQQQWAGEGLEDIASSARGARMIPVDPELSGVMNRRALQRRRLQPALEKQRFKDVCRGAPVSLSVPRPPKSDDVVVRTYSHRSPMQEQTCSPYQRYGFAF